MKCEVCKKSSKQLIECIECGSMFCLSCGDEKRERCNICMQFEPELDDQDSSSDN